MVSKNTTHLAGEFLVAGELARRGYPVSITLGNAKSVDIYAETQNGRIKVDAKAGRTKSNWPIGETTHIEKDVYYIFVYLQSLNKIRENVAPEYFVVYGKEIIDNELIREWAGGRRGVTYRSLNTHDYVQRWDKLGLPSKQL